MFPWASEPWTSLLIMDKLKKLEPSLDLQHADAKLLKVCSSDFENYIDYLECASVLSKDVLPVSVELEVTLTNESQHVIVKDENIKEATEFIQMWVKSWWKKYKERVQITIVKSPRFKPSELLKKGIKMVHKFSKEEKDDIEEAVIRTLIKNKEICCTKILASGLFKRILGGYSEKTKWTPEEKLNLMTSVIKEARRMSRVHGVLIFMKPDKEYYRLREFRGPEGSLV